jgi:hypothetical protein
MPERDHVVGDLQTLISHWKANMRYEDMVEEALCRSKLAYLPGLLRHT